MRYGSEVREGHNLFPLGISAVELAPEGHLELMIGHAYAPKTGWTMAGRVLLNPAEAIALADELRAMADPHSQAQPMDHRHT